MKKDELIKFAMGNEKLKKNLLELQREVESVGMTKAAYAEKIQAIFAEAGNELTNEEVESLIQPGEVRELSDDDLANVSGGCAGQTCYNGCWCTGYNKRCPESTSYCDVYCT